ENAGSSSTGAWTITTMNGYGNMEFSSSASAATTTVSTTLSTASTSAFYFSSGASASQLTVNGAFTDNGVSYQYNGPAYQPVIFGSGSSYTYTSTGGTHYCVYGSWNSNSTFNMTGSMSSMIQLSNPTGSNGDLTNQTFGIFNWNTTGMSVSPTL